LGEPFCLVSADAIGLDPLLAIDHQEESATSIEKIFINQLLMIGVITGCGYTMRMTMKLFLFHYLFFTQTIED
jgi:hypothetical protein